MNCIFLSDQLKADNSTVRKQVKHLEHWSAFFTQQHVVIGIAEICCPHAPVTTAGVHNRKGIIDLTCAKQSQTNTLRLQTAMISYIPNNTGLHSMTTDCHCWIGLSRV